MISIDIWHKYHELYFKIEVRLSCRADRNNEMHAPYECGSIGHV